MQGLGPEQFALTILQYVALAGLVVRMLLSGLYKTYPFFFGYLLVQCLASMLPVFFDIRTVSYVLPWVITQSLLTFFGVLIVLELYGLVLGDLTGLSSMLRQYLKICVAFAIAASLLLMRLEETPHSLTSTFTAIDRAVVGSLLVFVLLLTAFLVYFPIPISLNVLVYSVGYVCYFMIKGAGLLVWNIFHTGQRQFGDALLTASIMAMLFWLLGLRREGQKRKVVIGHRWDRTNQDQLMARLEALNATLLRPNTNRTF